MNLKDLAIDRDPTTGRWILRFDASLYKESDCMIKVWYKLFRGLRPTGKEGFYAGYGNAIHRALKVIHSKGTLTDATTAAYDYYSKITVPDSEWHNMAHLVNCIMQYHEFYKHEGELLVPIEIDGTPLLEQNFAIPLYRTDSIEVMLCGTMDMIAWFAKQQKVIVDHKTRTPKKCTIFYADEYFKQYILSPQLMTYKYVYRKLFPGDDVDCIINGIFLDEKNRNIFKRSEVFSYSEHQMKMFEFHLMDRVINIVKRFETILRDVKADGKIDFIPFPPNYTCCTQWCEYLPIDSLPSPSDEEMIIENSYEKIKYDPLVFQN